MGKQKNKGTIRSRIKRGDEVVFVAGKEYNRYDSEGKRNPYTGKVIAVDPATRRIKVEGAMIVKKHQKANPQLNVEGGIVKQEAWVNVSNVAIVDPKTGVPTRVGYEIRDGKKVRIAKKSGEVIPDPGIFVKPEPEETETEESTTEKADDAKTETAAAGESGADSKETKDTKE